MKTKKNTIKLVKVKYPVKIGFKDKSGKEENYITDSNDNVVVGGWGDCCKIGGIRDKKVAQIIVKLLNNNTPNFYVKE